VSIIENSFVFGDNQLKSRDKRKEVLFKWKSNILYDLTHSNLFFKVILYVLKTWNKEREVDSIDIFAAAY